MQVLAEADMGFSRRRTERHRAATSGTLGEARMPPETIAILDISTHGCGFASRWPFQAGARVWLQLPGLERWGAIVAWWEDGQGGLEFAQPLHPMVALRFARDIAANEA